MLKLFNNLMLKTVLFIIILLVTNTAFSQEQHLKHTVAKGETIYRIASIYKVHYLDIIQLNPEAEKVLKINSVLLIPVNNCNVPHQIISHEVLPKQTLYQIAKLYKIKVEDIIKWNPEIIDNQIAIGQKINIQHPLGTEANLVQGNSILNNDTNQKVAYKEMQVDSSIVSSNTGHKNILIDSLLQYSLSNIGAKYRSGGLNIGGFDCSGLMVNCFEKINIALPRSSVEQASYGLPVEKEEASIGDLIFFSNNKRKNINHVGLITEVKDDEIKFIHSSTSSGVIVSSLNEKYYSKNFVKIKRVIH